SKISMAVPTSSLTNTVPRFTAPPSVRSLRAREDTEHPLAARLRSTESIGYALLEESTRSAAAKLIMSQLTSQWVNSCGAGEAVTGDLPFGAALTWTNSIRTGGSAVRCVVTGPIASNALVERR